MQDIEHDDIFYDVEVALKKLRPVAVPEEFFRIVEAALSADETSVAPAENTVAFAAAPHFSFRRVTTSAAILLGAVGLGVWGISSATDDESDPAQNLFASGASPEETTASRDDFHLVNIERRLNSRTPGEVVRNTDGSFSRTVRYSYMDEYRWENDETDSAYVELRPHEELVSMEMPVY